MYIHIRFLRNFRAAADIHKKRAEWPPSPYRLYCALVQAYYRHESTKHREALEVLEKLPPPTILTSMEVKKVLAARYVPSNTARSKPLERPYPFTVTDEVYFCWPGVEALQPLLPRINYLGTADSLVEATFVTKPKAGSFLMWEPSEHGWLGVRCPYQGLLEDLDLAYEGKEHRPAKQKFYIKHKVEINDDGMIPQLPKQTIIWEQMQYIMGLESLEYQPKILSASAVASTIRNAIGKKAKELGLTKFEAEVFSHEHKCHLAYMPLAQIFGRYPTGDIKGLAVCLPKEMTSVRRDLERCLYELLKAESEIPFWVGSQQWGSLRIVPPKEMRTLNPDSWCRPSIKWSSATPVGMKFLDSPNKREEWVRQECRWNGLPEPSYIEFHRFSLGRDAMEFLGTLRKSSDTKKTDVFLTHLTLEFPVPVSGPVLLGREKNFGIGIMYPWLEKESKRDTADELVKHCQVLARKYNFAMLFDGKVIRFSGKDGSLILPSEVANIEVAKFISTTKPEERKAMLDSFLAEHAERWKDHLGQLAVIRKETD